LLPQSLRKGVQVPFRKNPPWADKNPWTEENNPLNADFQELTLSGK